MRNISNKAKVLYLFLFIIFISAFGLFWLDYIGLIDMRSYIDQFRGEPEVVVEAMDDEPSLIEREEFEKEKDKLLERIEDLDKREALISEKEKELEAEREKMDEIKKGLDMEKKKFQQEKMKYAGYIKNVRKLADKIANMPPEESVKIMINWEDPLIIAVLRQMDEDAEEAGRASITPYLITLMPKEKASRIMYLMTEI
jgi:flagellar protein FlbB